MTSREVPYRDRPCNAKCTGAPRNVATLASHRLIMSPYQQMPLAIRIGSPTASGGLEAAQQKGLRERISPICTLSQNGYGALGLTCIISLLPCPARAAGFQSSRAELEATAATITTPSVAGLLPRRLCRSALPRWEVHSLRQTPPTKLIYVVPLFQICCVCSARKRQTLQAHADLSLRKGQ